MKTKVTFFKESGKYYTQEDVEIPDDFKAWHAREYVEKHLGGRLAGMTAVLMDPPWGYPSMVPNLGAKT